jgi:hypothetical protein
MKSAGPLLGSLALLLLFTKIDAKLEVKVISVLN